MGLVSSITHSIAHALGLSRSARQHPPAGPVGQFRGGAVQALYVHPRHQPPAYFSGQPAGTQLHQRTTFQVPPNTTIQYGNATVSHFSGSGPAGYQQHSGPYYTPANQASGAGVASQAQRHENAARYLDQRAPQRPPGAPPGYSDIGRFGDVSIPVTPQKKPAPAPAETNSSQKLPDLPPTDPEELKQSLFPCCMQLTTLTENAETMTLTDQKAAYAQALAEINNHVIDIKNLDEDDLDDLLLCFGIDTSGQELHGDRLRMTAYKKLGEMKKELKEDYANFKSDSASEIDRSLASTDSLNIYALSNLWLKYSDQSPPGNKSIDDFRSETKKMLQSVRDDLVPPAKSFTIPDIVVTDMDASDTVRSQPENTGTPPAPPDPVPDNSGPEVIEAPVKPEAAEASSPILSRIFSQPEKSALSEPAAVVGLSDKPTYSREEIKAHKAALYEEIASLKTTIKEMLSQVESDENSPINDEKLFEVLKITGLTRYQTTRASEVALQAALKKIRTREQDSQAAFIALNHLSKPE